MAKCCYEKCLWRLSYKHDRCSQEAAVNMHIGIKKYFHFVKKKAKMMINIDLDTPSDNCSCTFKCFRAVKLYKPVCWSDCVIVGFDQDGEYLWNSQSSLRRRIRSAHVYDVIQLVSWGILTCKLELPEEGNDVLNAEHLGQSLLYSNLPEGAFYMLVTLAQPSRNVF